MTASTGWSCRPESPKRGNSFAGVQGQIISLESPNVHNVILRLSDALINLDQPVTVVAAGKTVFSGLVSPSAAMLSQSLEDRADPFSAACAQLKVDW